MPGQSYYSNSEGGDTFHSNHNNDAPPEVGVGFSDQALLVVSVVGFGIMTLLVYAVIVRKTKSAEEMEAERDGELGYEEELVRADVSTLNRAQRRARAKALMKRQRRVEDPNMMMMMMNHQEHGQDGDDDDHLDGGAGIGGDDQHHPNHQQQQNHLSRKDRQKAAKVAEKKERHLFDEERRKQQQLAQEAAQQEKQERMRLEAERAEEERLQREKEQEEKNEEAFRNWNTFLSSSTGKEASLTVEEWVQELRESKIVPLDTLAERFQVSTQTVKKRIQDLVQSGRVTGVLDEQNRVFVFITHQELLSLASFIKEKGEVSIPALSAEAAKLLVPDKPLS